MRVHLDTDFGGDPDDACALAMLLSRPDVEITGITTNLEIVGRRAGCVARYLGLAGRPEIPVAAGAETSLTTGLQHAPTWGDARHWPEPVGPRPGPPAGAVDLLAESIDAGATVIAIGALTNLAQLELDRPGTLRQTLVVVMGGWIRAPQHGLPQWGPELDWNIQCDTRATEIVLGAATDLTLVSLPATMRAHLRAADLPRLRAAGPVGELLARQSAVHAEDTGMALLAAEHAALPDDLVNFHWDPVTAAVAVGWSAVTVETLRLSTAVTDGLLRFRETAEGRAMRIVTDVDGPAFSEEFLARIESLA